MKNSMNKHLSLFLVSVLFPFALFSQQGLINDGVQIVITGNTSLYIDGGLDLYNKANTIINNGTIIITDTGNFVNDDVFVSGVNTNVKMLGSVQDIGGINSTEFSNLIVGGTDNKTISIDSYIRDSLIFESNHIILGTNNLILKEDANTYFTDSTQFVVTNTTSGYLIKYDVPTSDFLFPVGDSIFSYKPAILNVSVSDTFNVRVEAGLTPTTGNDPSYIQYTWIVEEKTPTLSKTGTLDLGWLHGDEGTMFTPAVAMMSHYNGTTWGIEAGISGASSNLPSSYYHYDGVTGISNFDTNNNRFIIGTSDPVIADAGSDITICRGWCDTLEASATGGVTSYTYLWSSGSTADTTIVCPTTTTTYTVTISDATGSNSDTDEIVVTVVYPNANAGVDISICTGGDTTLTASGGGTYIWSTSLTDTNASVTVTPTVTTTYTVTVTDALGCTNTDDIVVTLLALPPSPNVSNEAICRYHNTVIFDVINPNSGYTYYWYDSTGTLFNTGTSYTETNPQPPATYYIQYIDSNGCVSLTDSAKLTLGIHPVADFTVDDSLPYEGEEVQFLDLSTNADNWHWWFGDGNESTDKDPLHIYNLEGIYWVQLVVCSAIPPSCCDTIRKDNYMHVFKKTDIYIPTTFTPNGDGLNDKLYVKGESIESLSFKVYNQWGILIFETDNQLEGWDGIYNGSPQPEGNFVYILYVETSDEQEIYREGIISLIR